MTQADQQKAVGDLASGMQFIIELTGPLLDATVGYRARAEQAGFSPTQAEFMAGEFHRELIKLIFRQAKP